FAGSISGRLLDAQSAEPIVGIEVTYWNEAESFWTNDVTDSDGSFLLDSLPEGFAEIKACPEINTGYAYQPSDCRQVYLAEGQSKSGQIITLQKGALVQGYIKDVNMTSMAEVEYDCDGIYCSDDGVTDTNGMYQIRLPFGQYVISLYEENYNDFNQRITVTDVSQTTDVNDIIVYSAGNGATISGTVTNPGSYSYEGGFSVVAIKAGTVINADSIHMLRGVGEDFLAVPGAFTISALPTDINCDIYLVINQDTGSDREVAVIHDVQYDVSAGTSDVDLLCVLQSSSVIGRVINEDSQPVLGAVVVLNDQTTGAFAGFIDADEQGDYIIQNVPAGTYTFTAVHSRYLNTSVIVQVTDDVPVNVDAIVMPYAAQKEGPDLNGNGTVNMSDFAIFANQWMQSGSLESNFNQQGVVDFNDLIRLAENWLGESIWHYVVGITPY
ncbi:MAG: carboxypeptidase regulatory-like domain-containing protein, partial [Phycisphaerae bacterium]|nr:carboxypeptidase regulatory-like domain-containing protein [Phycisphaerae bacterium]